jgi:hypothetical protein
MMNQDTVKKNLLKLHECAEDFNVIFSGKKCRKVNGLYKIGKNEIIIHNRNFNADDKGNNLLFFTAMHEYAHHIQFTEHKQKSARAHTQLFYSVLDDLADTAEKKGLYNMEISKDTQKLVDEARNISVEIAELQQRLGKVINALHGKCEKEGVRFEDVVERKVQISKQTMERAKKADFLSLSNVGVDIQEAAIKERDDDKRTAIIHAGAKGKSVAQAKRATAVPVLEEDETVSLVKEKRRLERTIENLKHRLEEVEEQLIMKGEH